MSNDPAPIALFAFRRPDHLKQTLEALALNTLARSSAVIVFADGPGKESDLPGTTAVRQLLGNWRNRNVFRSFRIEAQESNRGLARSIIAGVTQVLGEFGRVVVVEDDLVTSPAFLEFMNRGLDMYANDPRVASIHGYCYPISDPLPPAFFMRGADCWGWATWSRAWTHFQSDGAQLLRQLSANNLHHAFDLDGSRDLVGMLEAQVQGRNDSWAIRWHASAFLAGLFTLYPGRSLVHNIGNDASGTHCKELRDFDTLLAQDAPTPDAPVFESPEVRQIHARWFRAHSRLRGRIGMALRRLRRRLTGHAP